METSPRTKTLIVKAADEIDRLFDRDAKACELNTRHQELMTRLNDENADLLQRLHAYVHMVEHPDVHPSHHFRVTQPDGTYQWFLTLNEAIAAVEGREA